MNNRDLILSSVQIIEKNLKSKLSVLEISKELGFSVYYYSRLFKSITGYSPKSYILARKITESIVELVETDIRIIDIAIDFGFGSSEAYSRAFCKILNKNPSDVRKGGCVNKNLLLQPITDRQLKKYEHALDKQPEIVDLDEINLIGIPFYYDLSMKNDLSDQWTLLIQNISLISNVKEPAEFYQLQFSYPNQDNDKIYFYIAVVVDKIEHVPIHFTAKTIPAQRYYKFRHKGLANEVGHTYRYIYEEWLPSTEYKLPGYFNFEYYGEEYLGPYNKSSISDIYIPVENITI